MPIPDVRETGRGDHCTQFQCLSCYSDFSAQGAPESCGERTWKFCPWCGVQWVNYRRKNWKAQDLKYDAAYSPDRIRRDEGSHWQLQRRFPPDSPWGLCLPHDNPWEDQFLQVVPLHDLGAARRALDMLRAAQERDEDDEWEYRLKFKCQTRRDLPV
jgi:hypothetical protein